MRYTVGAQGRRWFITTVISDALAHAVGSGVRGRVEVPSAVLAPQPWGLVEGAG